MDEKFLLKPLIKPLRKRLNAAIWMNSILGPLIFLIGAFAILLILLKMLEPDYAAHSLAVFILLPVLMVYRYRQCVKQAKFFREYEVVEILDHVYRNDGSVTAFYERPDLIPDPDIPSPLSRDFSTRLPRLDAYYYIKRIIPVCLFSCVALAIPPRSPVSLEQNREILSTITQPLFDKIDENKDLLSEEERADLLDKLEQLKKDEQGISREKWEAVEEIQNRMDQTLAKKNQNIQKMLSDTNEMSKILNEPGKDPGNAQTQAQLDKLQSGLKLAGSACPMSAPMQQKMDQLMKQMKEAPNTQQLKAKLAELQKQLGSCCKGSAYQLCEGEGGKNADSGGNEPGRGGINRGRGDAPMIYGEEKKLANAKYQEKMVQNQFLSQTDLIDLGITPVEPQPDPAKFSPGTVKQFESLEGAQVSRTKISPTQKEVISKYFSRNP